MKDNTEEIRKTVCDYEGVEIISLRVQDAFDSDWWRRIGQVPDLSSLTVNLSDGGELSFSFMRIISEIFLRPTLGIIPRHRILPHVGPAGLSGLTANLNCSPNNTEAVGTPITSVYSTFSRLFAPHFGYLSDKPRGCLDIWGLSGRWVSCTRRSSRGMETQDRELTLIGGGENHPT